MKKSNLNAGRAGTQEPEPLPGVVVGDEVYFRHHKGPASGRVVCHGKHGATVEMAGGQQHRVKWQHVLAHKRRAAQDYEVEEEGEDGMIVRDAAGGRHFIGIPPEAREDKMIVKSVGGGRRLVLLAKALPGGAGGPPAPGLSQKKITDKNGVQTTRWVNTRPDDPPAEPGHHVGFVNGEHKGHGKVMAAGPRGVTVQDPAGGVHRVEHGSLTHRWEGGGAPPAGPHEAAGAGAAGAASPASPHDAPQAGADLFQPGENDHLPAKVSQPHATWEDLVKHGTEGLAQFKGQLGKVAQVMGLKSGMKPEDVTPEQWANDDGFLFIAPLKGEKRAKEKVEADYGGDYSQLRDMVRGTISVPTMGHVKQALAHMKDAGLELATRPKDRFAKPTSEGYRDLMTFVKLPNGMVAELQIHVKAMTLAKEDGHAHYETTRSLQAKYNEDQPSDKWSDEDHTKFYQASKAQRDIYGKAWASASGGESDASLTATNGGKSETIGGGETLRKSLLAPKIALVFRRF